MGRTRNQVGVVLKQGAEWKLRFVEDQADGTRQKVSRGLGLISDYPEVRTETQARVQFAAKIAQYLMPVNQGRTSAVSLTLGEFIDQVYFPHCEKRCRDFPNGNEFHLEPSTINSYRDIYKVHVQDKPVAKLRVADFKPRDGQAFMLGIDQFNLSHQTHLRIKNFLRGVFSQAIQSGTYENANPMADIKAGGYTKDSTAPVGDVRRQKIRESNNHAYTLEEVTEMMDKLPEPARTVCAVAAFTGLSRSELKGLKWEDYDGETISVTRKVIGTTVGGTKTEARETGVPVVELVQKILTKYKKKFPSMGDGWIFRGEKLLRPLDLDNLSRRDIPQYINGAWFGWHSFRRGLGTRLNDLGVDNKTIQSILRHGDISTTQGYYIKSNPENARAGLKKLAAMAVKKYGIKV